MAFRPRLASGRKAIKQKYLTTERSKGMIRSCRELPSGISEANPPASLLTPIPEGEENA